MVPNGFCNEQHGGRGGRGARESRGGQGRGRTGNTQSGWEGKQVLGGVAEKENGRVGEKKKAWASLLLRGICIHLAFRLVYVRSTGGERGETFSVWGKRRTLAVSTMETVLM